MSVLWIVIFTCFVNVLAVNFSSWGYQTFGRLAIAWLVFGTGVLVWQIFSRNLHWWVVLSALALAVFGFCINAEMLAKITDSV